jgi:hypothetical protein
VDKQVGHVLRAGAELEHRQNLGASIDGQPQPQYLRMAAEPGSQLVQLQLRELEMAEIVFMQGVRMLTARESQVVMVTCR